MRIDYFQLIDRIVSIDLTAQSIRTEAHVPATSTIFEGHFPGFPLMPGVLLIEAMAQTAGWLVIGVTKFARMPFLASVKEAKLRAFVRPGQQLTISATLMHEGSGFAVATTEISCEDKLSCNAQLTLRLVDFPTPELRAGMEAAAARLNFPLEAVLHG